MFGISVLVADADARALVSGGHQVALHQPNRSVGATYLLPCLKKQRGMRAERLW
jgi:hypothetical protein